MSISSRQSDLFAGEIWTVLYQAFTSINFNASDPASINQALQTYIQQVYPENFNDWVVQSEFIAIIDLVSWLAGVLAFKTDLSVRENFIDTAEAKTSILRLARFLSYNPARNQCASGVVKITEVTTNDDVYDSYGNNLNGITVTWNDPSNSLWYEQFTAILNASFVSTNPYGVPLKTGTIQGVNCQLYRVNGLFNQSNFSFSSTVGGTSMDFEICNGDFTDGQTLFERAPNPLNSFNFYYLSDGNGNGSAQTGFFFLFKQGSTQEDTFTIGNPVVNQVLTVSGTGINNTDVWVQTVDNSGNVLVDWTQVPAVLDQNITYNQLPVNQRNIFAVITLENDGVSVRFSDGLYGNAPSGNIQITYRTSNGLSYAIQPQDIDNVNLPVSYINAQGVSKTINMGFSLYSTVSNSVPAETIEQIRNRAPQVYQTQARMVSGEDYNSFPLQTNLALKIKAVNRVYSGQSRYIDLHDPTGTYQDLSIFADDGIFFSEENDFYVEVPVSQNYTPNQFVENYIQPPLTSNEATNAVQSILVKAAENGGIPVPSGLIWTQSQASLYTSTGSFATTTPTTLITAGAMLQFSLNGASFWVGVTNVIGSYDVAPALNTAGPVTLSEPVSSGAVVTAILPAYVSLLPNTVVAALQTQIQNRLSFSLYYDYAAASWTIGTGQSSLGDPVLNGTTILMLTCNYLTSLWQITARQLRYVFESITSVEWFDDGSRAIDQQTGDASMDLIRVLPINTNLNDQAGYSLKVPYDFTIDKIWLYPNGYPEPRRTTVIFADDNEDGFPDRPDSFINIVSATNTNTYLFWSTTPPAGVTLTSNVYPSYNVMGFDSDTLLLNSAPLPSGYYGTWDANRNTPPLVSGGGFGNGATQAIGRYYVVSTSGATVLDGTSTWAVGDVLVFNGLHWVKMPAVGSECFSAASGSASGENVFWIYNGPSAAQVWTQDFSGTYSYAIGRGPNVATSWATSTEGTVYPSGDQLSIQWKHYAPSTNRIDPSSQNINDIFVLTYEYDTLVRQWIAAGCNPLSVPSPPTELDLRIAFSSMENYRMFSDALVWRPVSYKYLFGNNADPEVQMTFKVVRIANAAVSNGEIQTQVINTINTYFDAAYWDFGETFYWSELCAYIHQQLAGMIASIVPVPMFATSAFGDGFEISSRPDQIFVSTAQVSNVVIIDSNTPANLRIITNG